MSRTTFVNFHTHTSFSDGAQTPEVLATELADAGVRYVALTDHDTVAGLARFRAAIEERGIASLPGIELTTQLDDRLVHLLAYGFDPEHPELAATLASMKRARLPDYHSVAGSLRAARRRSSAAGADGPAPSAAPDGLLSVDDAISLVHRAGGCAFLAHPLTLEPDQGRLEKVVLRLKAMGLDGIEAIYAEFPPDDQAALRRLAREHHLLVSAGTDYHAANGLGSSSLGIDMPQEDWLRFRGALLASPGLSDEGAEHDRKGSRNAPVAEPAGSHHRLRRRSFILRVALPAAAAMALFLIALWGLILPSFEHTLVERKREMIRELTNSAWSVLAAYEQDERAGVLSRVEAQAAAMAVVEQLRYGDDRLDYFWIQDTQPTMVMHPYRADLDGQDLSGFTDPRGVPIFVEFAEVVEAEQEGYVDYVWQWFDEPDRLEPKESYVKAFEPWDWVIGTGLYTDDVRAEIDRIEQDVVLAALGISGAIALLLLFVLQQSLRIEQRREDGVERLRHSNARYQALVEATTEGTLLVVDGGCRYANSTFLELLGYSPRQLEFLEATDVLPREPDNAALWGALDSADPESSVLGVAREGVLRHADGSLRECLLTLDVVAFGGQTGHILLARDAAASSGAAGLDWQGSSVPAGVFRALAGRRGVFVEISPLGRELVRQLGGGDGEQAALADCFADSGEFGRLHQRVLEQGEVRDYLLAADEPAGARTVLLSAAVARDEQGEPAYIDGLLVDVTAVRGEAAGRAALLQQLEASPLFLHQTIDTLAQAAIVVELDSSLAEVARQMTERAATAALVTSGSDTAVGIVTDRDLRARALAVGRAGDDPVHTVMTSPLIRIERGALIYEALMRMEEHVVRHLAVDDGEGRIVGVVDRDALMPSLRYAPLVLLRAISAAESPRDVARAVDRAGPLAAGLMDSSARPRLVTTLLTATMDAATVRLTELAIAELGPAPVPFAILAMGSQGRGEVTFLTDQDSGIVYADAGATDEVAAYFGQLGARLCDAMEGAGYPRCPGNVMASDPRWCRSQREWRAAIEAWVRRAEPRDITDLSVFLDFRAIHGDAALAAELRRHVNTILPDERGVQYQLALNALTFKPPMRLPGNIYLGGGAEHGEIDLKDALQSLVAFARVYAADHRISRTHTLERLAELASRDLITAATLAEITDAYDFLMTLRLQRQSADARAGVAPTSSVELASLTHTQRELMRQAFGQIASVQKRAEDDFPELG